MVPVTYVASLEKAVAFQGLEVTSEAKQAEARVDPSKDEFRFQQAGVKNPHSEAVPMVDQAVTPMPPFPTSVEVPYVPVNLNTQG